MPRDGRPNRQRILDVAERLVIDGGYAGTSLDQVIAAAGTSKGAFFHHFSSKADLAGALVERYAAADVDHLRRALAATAEISHPVARLDAFLGYFEDGADELMSEQSSCLYVAVLTERQLIGSATTEPVRDAVLAWRRAIADLLGAVTHAGATRDCLDALADHVFVTFEGAFLLCRATGEPAHMRRQLAALRRLIGHWAATWEHPPPGSAGAGESSPERTRTAPTTIPGRGSSAAAPGPRP